MLLDIKLSKAQLYKTIQSDGFFGDLTISLGKKITNRPCCFLG